VSQIVVYVDVNVKHQLPV